MIGHHTIEVLHGHVDFRLWFETWRRWCGVLIVGHAIGFVGVKALWRWRAIAVTATASATATAAPSATSALLAAIAFGASIRFGRVTALAIGCIVIFDFGQMPGCTIVGVTGMVRLFGKIFALFGIV